MPKVLLLIVAIGSGGSGGSGGASGCLRAPVQPRATGYGSSTCTRTFKLIMFVIYA